MLILKDSPIINSVLDYDKIIIINNGNIAEIGHPFELLVRNPFEDEQISKKGPFA